MKKCSFCDKELSGRKDKKYCNSYCKSAYEYSTRRTKQSLYNKVDQKLKRNRKILKKYSGNGKTVMRQATLKDLGFNPNYFTNYWKNPKGQVYFFCYEFGFMPLSEYKSSGPNASATHEVKKYLLVQWQPYMEKE